MRRRDFLRTGAIIGVSTTLAGCSDGSDQNTPADSSTAKNPGDEETPTGTEPGTDEDDQQTTEDPETAVRYFFKDETGALGHLADDEIPENYDHVVTNTASEQEYDEMQRNDRSFAEDAASNQKAPQGEGLEMTVDEMINEAEPR